MKRFCILILALTLSLGLALGEEAQSPVSYSPRFLAVNAAQHAMAEKYSVTEGMNENFSRSVTENEDGSYTVLWQPAFGDSPMSWLMGTYTAVVRGEQVDITWTHDGEETYGGYTAPAWGALQLRDMCDEVRTSWSMTESWEAAAQNPHASEEPYPFREVESGFTNDEDARAQAEAQAAVTPDEADAAARMALQELYGSLEWWRLETTDGEFGWNIGLLCGRPVIIIHYDLWGQGMDDWEWQEGDGSYDVTVNLATGDIEEILYSNGLSGNG